MKSWPSTPVPTLTVQTPQAPTAVSAFDSVHHRVEQVGPASTDAQTTATMYVCGITPYDATHLGHANTYLSFDLLHRAWLDLGLTVRYTQNVTDVDDPLIERARATGVDWSELADSQIALFADDMEALRVLPPDHYPGAVESIDLVVSRIQELADFGAAYQLQGQEHADWYFDVTSTDSFGSLAGLDPEQARAKFIEMGGDPDRPGKRNPLDPVLWLQARPDEPAWDSPLGAGRPGWHIECAAISLHSLGVFLDVQGGGQDLLFPHHEMCAAQATALTGRPFARHYLHSGLVGLDGEKMSKSKGNLELVSRLRRQGVDPRVIRLAMLNHHWRESWEWTPAELDLASQRLEAWTRFADSLPQSTDQPSEQDQDGEQSALVELTSALRTALRTDLDAPQMLAIVDDFVANPSGALSRGEFADVLDALLGTRL